MVITPPAGVKGVTRAGNPFIVSNLQTLQTLATTSSCSPRCRYSPSRTTKRPASAASSFLTVGFPSFCFLLSWNLFAFTQHIENPFDPRTLSHTIFSPSIRCLPPRRSESNIQSISLVPKSTFRIGFARPRTVTANQNIYRTPCTPLSRHCLPLALLMCLELDQNQYTSHRTILRILQSITDFKFLLSAISPLRQYSSPIFLYPPLLCPHL
jgi:hypothetical protein